MATARRLQIAGDRVRHIPTTLGWGMTVGQAGVIYLVVHPYLPAIEPDGALRWKLRSDRYTSFPAESPDGLIYVRSRERLIVLNPDGTYLDEQQVVREYIGWLAVGEGFIQDGPVRHDRVAAELWRAETEDEAQVVYSLADPAGNTLLVRYSMGQRTQAFAPTEVTLLDTAGQPLWTLDEVVTAWSVVQAGDRRICMIGMREGDEAQASLFCYGDHQVLRRLSCHFRV